MPASPPVERSPDPRARRSRFRFGLRAGLVAVAAFAGLLGLIDFWCLAPYRAERRAAAAMTGLGGRVLLVDEAPAWLRRYVGIDLLDLRVAAMIDLGHSRIADADLAHLRSFRRFGQLNLADTEIGDDGLEHLRAVVAGRYFDLSRTRVTNAARLFGNRSIDHPLGLKLAGNRLARGPILFIAPQWCPLQDLDLSDTDADDQTLASLPDGLINLHDLNLRGTVVGDDGLESLFRMDGLRKLDLRATRVTGRGVARLKSGWKGRFPLTVLTDPFPLAGVAAPPSSSPK